MQTLNNQTALCPSKLQDFDHISAVQTQRERKYFLMKKIPFLVFNKYLIIYLSVSLVLTLLSEISLEKKVCDWKALSTQANF